MPKDRYATCYVPVFGVCTYRTQEKQRDAFRQVKSKVSYFRFLMPQQVRIMAKASEDMHQTI